ncbi:NAD(P)/FAD-dependent oxidoreductase [Candidatus Atribacteria bacterium 1244-E10-H5-B2]|nr:MAG: NAD(P)/FAD-dependent oxidoreductase [Candidatus Atribacteria bacterium 1244-E10-H5-B2]
MEIVIVGAGPIGCYTAQLLKKCGINSFRIIEEHDEVGKPVRCAGIVGKPVFEDSLIPLSRSSILNQINGTSFFYRGDSFKIERSGVALVIDREKFDKELSQGLEVECGIRLLEVEEEQDKGSRYRLKTNQGDIWADIVMGADGPRSRVKKFIDSKGNNSNGYDGSDSPGPGETNFYKGVQYRIKLEDLEGEVFSREMTRVYMREGIPFFVWIIPEGNGIIRLGVIAENGRRELERVIEEEGIKGEIIDRLAGIIPLGLCQSVYKKVMVVGDAARQVKPLTGGGIYYGMKAAEILVECIQEGMLAEYDKRWKSKFGREIKFGLWARKVYERLNKGEYELKNIFSLFKENAEFIERAANFENHSLVFREAFKNPKIFIGAGKILGRNIGKILF